MRYVFGVTVFLVVIAFIVLIVSGAFSETRDALPVDSISDTQNNTRTQKEQLLVNCDFSSTNPGCSKNSPKDLGTSSESLPVAAEKLESKDIQLTQKKFVEIVKPSGFVNSNNHPVALGEYIGKKVIVLNVMTYSCSNCQATFPYVNSWYEKYKNDGLVVIGLHTPEFAFEKDKKNVEEAMLKFGITYPVIMDNEYATWNAYGNRFWPRKYLIDIHGNIVYDHIGEGAYAETEAEIIKALVERKRVLGLE